MARSARAAPALASWGGGDVKGTFPVGPAGQGRGIPSDPPLHEDRNARPTPRLSNSVQPLSWPIGLISSSPMFAMRSAHAAPALASYRAFTAMVRALGSGVGGGASPLTALHEDRMSHLIFAAFPVRFFWPSVQPPTRLRPTFVPRDGSGGTEHITPGLGGDPRASPLSR